MEDAAFVAHLTAERQWVQKVASMAEQDRQTAVAQTHLRRQARAESLRRFGLAPERNTYLGQGQACARVLRDGYAWHAARLHETVQGTIRHRHLQGGRVQVHSPKAAKLLKPLKNESQHPMHSPLERRAAANAQSKDYVPAIYSLRVRHSPLKRR